MGCIRCVLFLAVLGVLALVFMALIPNPGAPTRVLHGTVIRADLAPVGRGSTTLLWVRLDDGSTVSCAGNMRLPDVSSRIDVVETHGLFGMRQIDCPH